MKWEDKAEQIFHSLGERGGGADDWDLLRDGADVIDSAMLVIRPDLFDNPPKDAQGSWGALLLLRVLNPDIVPAITARLRDVADRLEMAEMGVEL